METHNLVTFEENKITLKYETETLVYEKLKTPINGVGVEYINFEGDRYFLTKRKS